MKRPVPGLPVLLLWLAMPAAALAHEVRPAYLDVTRLGGSGQENLFQVVWRRPLVDGLNALDIVPSFPASCREVERALPEVAASARIDRFRIDCGASGLEAQPLGVEGLERTLADVLLRLRFDSEEVVTVLHPQSPSFVVHRSSVALAAYLRLGIEHLLFGFDHLLFVVGLMFLVRRVLELVKVISAFTLAHSATLALSTLGIVRLSPAPVEAAIALSILFLAVEILEPPGRRSRWLEGRAWVIAFGFGLLHGFGFAGALAEIGLPERAAGWALLLFNLGVEVGQLVWVGALLVVLFGVRVMRLRLPSVVARLPVWLIGAVSAFWFIERVARMV